MVDFCRPSHKCQLQVQNNAKIYQASATQRNLELQRQQLAWILFFNVICSTSHLVVLKVISHLLAHIPILNKLHCSQSSTVFFSRFNFLYNKQSSANELQEEVIHSSRSLPQQEQQGTYSQYGTLKDTIYNSSGLYMTTTYYKLCSFTQERRDPLVGLMFNYNAIKIQFKS